MWAVFLRGEGLDGVDDQEIGLEVAHMDLEVLQGADGEQEDVVGMDVQPFGPELDLQRRLLAGIIEHFLAFLRQHGRYFQQQGRLPHPGLAADQDHRVADDAAAQDAVEFVHAGDQPLHSAGSISLIFCGALAGRDVVLAVRIAAVRSRPGCSRPGIAGSARNTSGSGSRTRCTRTWLEFFVLFSCQS